MHEHSRDLGRLPLELRILRVWLCPVLDVGPCPLGLRTEGVGGGGDLDCRPDLRCSHSGCWTMPSLWTLRQLLMDLQTPHQPMLFEGRSPVERCFSQCSRSRIRKSNIQKKPGLLKIISKIEET